MKEEKKVPLIQALLWIVGSMILVSGTSYSLFTHFLRLKKHQKVNKEFAIDSIIQTGPQKEVLKTTYLAELMGLSHDRPISSKKFDPIEARKKLLKSPVIKDAEVKLFNNTTVFVDYTVRQPLAWLYDFENIAIDEEGYLFPVSPFFSPKNLPEIYLGLQTNPSFAWDRPMKGPLMELAFSLLNYLSEPCFKDLFHLVRIDVSNADATSYGQREIVLTLEDEVPVSNKNEEVRFLLPKILRLTPKNFPQELSNYLNLRDTLIEQETKNLVLPEEGTTLVHLPEKVIDFRIPKLAFIDERKTQ